MRLSTWVLVLCALAVSSCSAINPISEDRMPTLSQGEGLAGLAFDSDGRISQVVIAPASDNGKNLYIPAIPNGQSLFLFVAPVGQYCMRQFHVGNNFYTAQHDDQCFEVKEGKLSYGGNYAPYTGISGIGGAGGMSQGEDMQEFLNLLNRDYPNIAAATLQEGGRKPVSQAAVTKIPKGVCDLLSKDDAAKLLGLPVGEGVPSNILSINGCTYYHSDKEKVYLAMMLGVDGDQASASSNGDNEMFITANGRGVILTVDGSPRGDLAAAMQEAAAKIKASLESY